MAFDIRKEDTPTVTQAEDGVHIFSDLGIEDDGELLLTEKQAFWLGAALVKASNDHRAEFLKGMAS